jgi:hypothetical protein
MCLLMKGVIPLSYPALVREAVRRLKIDGVGGEIRRHASKRVKFMLRSEFEELLPIEASTMKKVANRAPVVDCVASTALQL